MAAILEKSGFTQTRSNQFCHKKKVNIQRRTNPFVHTKSLRDNVRIVPNEYYYFFSTHVVYTYYMFLSLSLSVLDRRSFYRTGTYRYIICETANNFWWYPIIGKTPATTHTLARHLYGPLFVSICAHCAGLGRTAMVNNDGQEKKEKTNGARWSEEIGTFTYII